MAWFRQELDYISHPKFIQLSDGSFRLWHEGKCWVEANLSDGILPFAVANGFRYFAPRRAKELTIAPHGYTAGLWEVIDGVGYKMHDYLYFNPSREEVLARRMTEAERKRRARERLHDARMTPESTAPCPAGQDAGQPPESDTPVQRNILCKSESESKKEVVVEREIAPPLPPPVPSVGVVFTGTPALQTTPKPVAKIHRGHFMCGPRHTHCIHQSQHAEFENQLAGRFGGDTSRARAKLEAWYQSVWASLPPDDVTDNIFVFWRDLFGPEFNTKRNPAAARSGPPPPKHCRHTPRCADDVVHTSRYMAEMERVPA